ncbi:hypothetical protein DL96DRAFT_1771864 [Flagelloscypha sp. PMI_526]|nr:hypothetical protein DL96DRAFT_1771864 [Flagelloscypha sp. PMI_526]
MASTYHANVMAQHLWGKGKRIVDGHLPTWKEKGKGNPESIAARLALARGAGKAEFDGREGPKGWQAGKLGFDPADVDPFGSNMLPRFYDLAPAAMPAAGDPSPAMFLDVFNVSSLMVAIPSLAVALLMNWSKSTWAVSAFQLTFLAFLLHYYFFGPVPHHWLHEREDCTLIQAFHCLQNGGAVGVFGATRAIGNILGLIIGTILTQYASWRWVFWFAMILALPAVVIGATMILERSVSGFEQSTATRVKHMDLLDIATVTVSLTNLVLRGHLSPLWRYLFSVILVDTTMTAIRMPPL